MGEKDIRISTDLYERLEELAGEDESVGDVLDRLVAAAADEAEAEDGNEAKDDESEG